MNKKTVIRAVALCVLLLLVCAGPMLPMVAHAESSLGVSAKVTPEVLLAAGQVEINIRLANNSSVMLEDVSMMARGIDQIVGNMNPGEKKSYNISKFNVQESELGGSVIFNFSWIEDGEFKTLEYPVAIKVKEPEPSLKASRTVSSNSGASGDTITVTYALQNTGDVDLTNVAIADPIFPDGIAVGDLAVGSGTKRVTKEFTLTETVTTTPVVTAQADSTTLTVELDPLEIRLTEIGLDLTASAGSPTKDGIPVTITVTNRGNVDFTSVALVDELGNPLATAFPLNQSQSNTVEVVVNPAEPRSFVVTATGTLAVEGSVPVVVSSSPVALTPVLSTDDIQLTASAKPTKTAFDEPGEVTFAVKLVNNSPVELYNVVISEENAGRLGSLDTLAIGAQTVNVSLLVDESRQVSFTVSFQDELGNSYSTVTEAVAITVGAAQPDETPGPQSQGGSSWMKWLLIGLIVLIVAVIATLVYLYTQGKRRRQQEEEADEVERILAQQSRRRPNPVRERTPGAGQPQSGRKQTTGQAGRSPNTPAGRRPVQTPPPDEDDEWTMPVAVRRERAAVPKTPPVHPQGQQPPAEREQRGPVLRDQKEAHVIERKRPAPRREDSENDLFEQEFMDDDRN